MGFIYSTKILLVYIALFFTFSLPLLYKFTNQIGLKTLSENSECPSLRGILIHSIIFSITLIILLTTIFKKEDDESASARRARIFKARGVPLSGSARVYTR